MLGDYFLYTGDGAVQAVWPHVVRLIGQWYANHRAERPLLNNLGRADYAYVRAGQAIAYYNAGYVRLLRMAAQLATDRAGPMPPTGNVRPSRRISRVLGRVASAFNDSRRCRHPPSGRNVFYPRGPNARADSFGVEIPPHTTQRKAHDRRHERLGSARPFQDETGERAYPFISYFDVVARFFPGSRWDGARPDPGGVGYMLLTATSTMWESIGPHGGPPPSNFGSPSWTRVGKRRCAGAHCVGSRRRRLAWLESFAAAPPVDQKWARGILISQGMIHFSGRARRKGGGEDRLTLPGTVTLPGRRHRGRRTHVVTGGSHKELGSGVRRAGRAGSGGHHEGFPGERRP